MKKILNLIFVNRKELNGKWWHRLYVVFLCSTLILISSLFLINFYADFNLDNFNKYTPLSSNFSDNYDNFPSDHIISCQLDKNAFSSNLPGAWAQIDSVGIRCGEDPLLGNVILDKTISDGYLGDIAKWAGNEKKAFGLDKYNLKNCPQKSRPSLNEIFAGTGVEPKTLDSNKLLTQCEIEMMSDEPTDPNYQSYLNHINNPDIKVKFDVTFQWNKFIYSIAYSFAFLLTILLVWIVFCSVIYRTILYIIYGNIKI